MITRYDPPYIDHEPHDVYQAKMEECGNGDYVTFDDYQDLLDKYEALQNRMNWVTELITDLYREV